MQPCLAWPHPKFVRKIVSSGDSFAFCQKSPTVHCHIWWRHLYLALCSNGTTTSILQLTLYEFKVRNLNFPPKKSWLWKSRQNTVYRYIWWRNLYLALCSIGTTTSSDTFWIWSEEFEFPAKESGLWKSRQNTALSHLIKTFVFGFVSFEVTA